MLVMLSRTKPLQMPVVHVIVKESAKHDKSEYKSKCVWAQKQEYVFMNSDWSPLLVLHGTGSVPFKTLVRSLRVQQLQLPGVNVTLRGSAKSDKGENKLLLLSGKE
jgi:hypothetical protein